MTRDTIPQALSRTAAAVVEVAPGRWALTLPGGAPAAVTAHADDTWLLLETAIAAAPAPLLLARNTTTTGGAHIVLAPAPSLRADVALDACVALDRRIAEACAGIGFAAGSPPSQLPGAMPDDELATRCHETSWPIGEREAGTLTVTLDVLGDVHQAQVTLRDDASVLVGVDLVDASASSPGRDALARLLLRAAGAVRMVRAAPPARFEVVFASMPSSDELAHAFAALSVACRLAAREAAVLEQDETVARAYLAHFKGGDPCRLP